MDTNKTISKFLYALTEKNYSEADKYLQAIVYEKLKRKVRRAYKETNLF